VQSGGFGAGWLVETLRRERDAASRPHASSWRDGIMNPAVWHLALLLFLIVTSG
jgi:hypothetical protein